MRNAKVDRAGHCILTASGTKRPSSVMRYALSGGAVLGILGVMQPGTAKAGDLSVTVGMTPTPPTYGASLGLPAGWTDWVVGSYSYLQPTTATQTFAFSGGDFGGAGSNQVQVTLSTTGNNGMGYTTMAPAGMGYSLDNVIANIVTGSGNYTTGQGGNLTLEIMGLPVGQTVSMGTLNNSSNKLWEAYYLNYSGAGAGGTPISITADGNPLAGLMTHMDILAGSSPADPSNPATAANDPGQPGDLFNNFTFTATGDDTILEEHGSEYNIITLNGFTISTEGGGGGGVPEPASLGLLTLGGLTLLARRRRQKS